MEDVEFEDEMRVGTRTELGKKYTPCGVRPSGRQHIGYEYLYLYVSIKPFTGEIFALFLPRLDKECFGIFTDEQSKRLKQKTLLILDGAGARDFPSGKNNLFPLRVHLLLSLRFWF